jgi:methyl-accepting chemotaxis protein
LVVPGTALLAYLVAENGVAEVLDGVELRPVRLRREQLVMLSENARGLWLAMSILAPPGITLSFILVAALAGGVQFHNLPVHLAVILALTALALLLIVREASRATRRSVDALISRLDAAARGELDQRACVGTTSELAYVGQCVEALSGSVEGLLGELGRMSREHEAGDVDAAVEDGRFPGAYGQIARGVNSMVSSHVALNRKGMQTVADFARGDFDATLPALPGKKHYINEVIEQVRTNLKGLVDELTRMTQAQAAGDVDAFIDEARFTGGFGAIARGMNGMARKQMTLTRKLLECVEQFGKGNFEAKLELFPGQLVIVNETVEQVRARLQALVADADSLSQAAVAGRFDVRAPASRHQGDYRRIVQGVNDTLDAIIGPVQKVAALLDDVADGDLSARLDPKEFSNDARALAERVNTTVAAMLAPVEEATTVLETLAQRDLRARMRGSYQRDHARMKDALNATAAALNDAIAQVAEAAGQVSSASAQIASSSQTVAAGASEQAASLQQTSASADSVSAVTRMAADNAQQANALTKTARTAAADGASAMDQMRETMGKIRTSAEGTSEIIRDVSDIAFQTNLLALNAAVEAARAGDAGRGFAVVAEEVRSLALRAKDAAQKTEALIRESVRQAAEGEENSRRVSGKLQEIVGGIDRVSQIVSEIAASAREQASGIEGMNLMMSEMDKVTQQNAASAEESSSAASELNGQAEELAAMVSSFKLDRNEVGGGARVARPGAALPPRAPHARTGFASAGRAVDPFPLDKEKGDLGDF